MALGFQFAEFDQFFLCRLCCQENYKHGLNLNTVNAIGKPLTELINQHLPFKVNYDPRLPPNICAGCLLQIQAIVEFRNLLDSGQKKILELFPIQDELDSNGVPKRKRGRPRKAPPSDNPPESPPKPENVQKAEETNEHEIGKRRRKAPAIFDGTVLGKELEKALEEEGIVDEDVQKPSNGNLIKNPTKEAEVLADFKCDVCEQDFRQENEFLVHQSSHKVLFTCSTCRENFTSFPTLETHQEETGHTGNDLTYISQKCFCGETYSSEELHGHIEQKHPKVFKCSTCPETFRFDVGLHAHKCSQAESGQFPCDICGVVLRHSNSLTYHKRTKHGPLDKTFECLKCDKTFKHRLLLLRHQQVHSTDRPFKCNLCDASFKTKSALNAHDVVHTKVKNFQCHICDQTFSHLSSLKLHLRCHTGKKPFQCDYCQKSFYQKGNLKEHYRTHTQEKPYLCNLCDRGFKTSSQVKSHMKIHLGDKPFKCEHCHKAFPYKFSLKNHLKRHEGGRPFMCDICSKEFRDRWSLKKHLRFHTGEKPYKCPFCAKAFSDCSNMIKHKMLHLKHVNAQRPAEDENPNFDIWNVLPGDEGLSKDKNVLSQILLIYPEDENQELTEQFSLNKKDDIQNKELEDGNQMNTMMQVTDEHGNPLSFTTQEGTTLQLTIDGESLQLTTSDGSTIPVQISTENDDVLQSMILPSIENEADEVDQNVEALEFVTDHQDVQLLAGLTESSLDFLPLT